MAPVGYDPPGRPYGALEAALSGYDVLEQARLRFAEADAQSGGLLARLGDMEDILEKNLPEEADNREKDYLRTSLGQKELVETLVKARADAENFSPPRVRFDQSAYERQIPATTFATPKAARICMKLPMPPS